MKLVKNFEKYTSRSSASSSPPSTSIAAASAAAAASASASAPLCRTCYEQHNYTEMDARRSSDQSGVPVKIMGTTYQRRVVWNAKL